MRIELANVYAFTIFDAPELDPITVVMQDYGGGRGRLIIECYGSAWSSYWGAMGPDTSLKTFVTMSGFDYLAYAMWPSSRKRTKSEYAYLGKIVKAVQIVLQST